MQARSGAYIALQFHQSTEVGSYEELANILCWKFEIQRTRKAHVGSCKNVELGDQARTSSLYVLHDRPVSVTLPSRNTNPLKNPGWKRNKLRT